MSDPLLRLARKAVFTPWHGLLNLADPPVIVLLYHRVATLARDPEQLAVTPENFRAQLAYLKENFPIVRFEADWSKTDKPAVALTFDDGFADNALQALPILEELGVPATFFVATGTIGTDRLFWWNELERIVLETDPLPDSYLDAPLKSTWATGTGADRRRFYREAAQLMTDYDTQSRNALLERIRTWAGSAAGSAGSAGSAGCQRSLSLEELRLLAKSGCATVGAHTVTHTRLSSLSVAAQREEIRASKLALEKWLGAEVTTFSYPYGKRSHYTQESIELCREAGFAKAAANFPGQAHRWSDPYQIPRHLVRDWPVELFAEQLKGFWTR